MLRRNEDVDPLAAGWLARPLETWHLSWGGGFYGSDHLIEDAADNYFYAFSGAGKTRFNILNQKHFFPFILIETQVL